MFYVLWFMVYMVYGLWFMVYGLWFMVYGLWFMVYGLWFMVYGSQLDSTCAAPPWGWVVGQADLAREPVQAVAHGDVDGLPEDAVALLVVRDDLRVAAADVQHHGVALQVAFERRTLKPVFHLIGYRLWV
jgi:hypothetical protein